MESKDKADNQSAERGAKALNLQHFFAMAVNLNLSAESSFLIAIATLACVFGAEIAGICILISKISHARRERLRMEEADGEAYTEESDKHNFAAALLFGAVPMSAQLALLILAIGTAVGALVFVVLLIVFRVQGYALISARALRREDSEEEAPAEYTVPEEAPVAAVVTEEPLAEAFEESEELFAEPNSEEESVETLFAEDSLRDGEAEADETVAESAEETVAESAEETVAESAEETVAEEPAVEKVPAEVPVSVVYRNEPVGMGQVTGQIPVYSSAYPAGQMPVIEKYVTETYKEIIRETNTTTTTNGGEKYSPATEEILKAIAELMKLGTQLRMEKELAVEHPMAEGIESVPAFAEENDREADELDEEDADVDEADELDDAEETSEKSEVEDDYESELFTGNERIVGFDEETGCYIVAHYRKSFEAKLIQARRETKKYYSEIKNALLSYEGTKDRISWAINTYTNDRVQVAKINMRARSLDLYLALDPASLEDSVYHGRDVGAKKKYAETPFLYKVNSPRKLALALELVQRTCEELGLSPIDIEPVNYEEQYSFEATEDLIRRGLIREYLREEKPAVSFELDPDVAPVLPEEDGSVIPANANFTWEFDNEQNKVKEEEPAVEEEPVAPEEPVVEEPETEEVPVEETVAKEVDDTPTSTTTTTTHETVKTTERHYTERYYGAPVPQTTTYQMISESTQPIEVPTLGEADESAVEETEEEVLETSADVLDEEIPVDSEEESVEEIEEIEEESEEEESEETLEWETLDSTEESEEETEEVYEDEAEEVYEDETEEVYEDETEEVYEDEAEEVYEDETEEVYEDEAEEVYGDETEEVYEDEAEEVYEDEAEEIDEAEEEIVYVDEDDDEVIYVDEDGNEIVYVDEDEEEAEEVYEEEVEEEEEPAPVIKPAATDSSVALLDVCCFDDHFENGAVVNLETLKHVGLAPESATTLKLYASGPIKGQYTVEANHFTLQAIEAINATDGTSIMIR